MLVPLASTDIASYVAEYEAYRRAKGEELRFYNNELEVDQFLSERLHLVWYGQFYRKFPNYWTLLPEMPSSEENTLFLKEKAKVRYICQACSHTWTSLNGSAKFWASTGHLVYFYLPPADCSQCEAPEQPALWYPDEVVRVMNNLSGFLTAGKAGRDEMENQVRYRRGVTRRPPSTPLSDSEAQLATTTDSAIDSRRSSVQSTASSAYFSGASATHDDSCSSSVIDSSECSADEALCSDSKCSPKRRSSNASCGQLSVQRPAPIPLMSIPLFRDEFKKMQTTASLCSEDSGLGIDPQRSLMA